MPDWRVENLRVTGFAASANTDPVEELWRAVVDVPIENINERRKDSTTTVEGRFEGGRLILAREPSRTDWVWAPDVDAPPENFPTIGEFGVVRDTFLMLAKKWLNRGPSLIRLAWGGVLLLPAASKEDGYRRLGDFLTQLKIDPISSDLNYQINRPRNSNIVEGLRVNRLSIWSVALFRPLAITISPHAGTVVAAGQGHSACRLQFDINSDPERKDPFEPRQLSALLDEFAGLAAELADRGDVP